jgi:hypothetical protein
MMRVVRLAGVTVLMLWMLPMTEALAAPSPPLFDPPPTVRAASSPASSRAIIRQRSAVARLGLLTRSDGSPALSAGDRVELNLFDDARFSMTVTEVARHAGHGLTWNGTLDGVDLGSAALAVYDGALVGQVWTTAATYRIGYAPDGTPVVEEIDQSALPRESEADAPVGAESLDAETPHAAGDTASQMDVMVLYTAAARIAAGGTAVMRAQVALAVAAANTAYGNNDLVQRIRLVYTGEAPIVETADFNADLSTLQSHSTVKWLRDVTRADLVSLLVDHGDSAAACGIGFVMRFLVATFAANAFNVVERNCASSNLSYPHELGHNMGAHHDAFVIGGDIGLAIYSKGWVDLTGKFRTVMAYNDQCAVSGIPSCQRIPYFSSPNKTFNGRTVGNAATADNSRTLSESADTVANFRQALASPLTITASVNQPTFAVGQPLVASVSLNHAGGLAGTTADFYVALLLPNGTAVFFTNVTITPTSGYALGSITNFATYRPIATGVPLGAPFSANLNAFLTYPRQAGDPTGGLTFFVFAVKSGALASNTFTSDSLIAASLAPFTFPATSPGDAEP